MIGKTLSHYRIESRLGKGGMGEVFLARDLRLERLVAIKILPAGGDPESDSERRFVAEARAASALNHPNIVTVHDFDRDGDVRFLVMELVEGEPISALISASLEAERFLDLAIQITGALGAAHAAGIVHHDIKPANLMLTRSGTVKVVDFGLARRLADNIPLEDGPTRRVGDAGSGSLTEPGTILGTFAYMAPEQLEGQRGNARSDVFSLGILFFELLSAQRPFDTRSPVAAMTSILRDPPKDLRSLRPDLPAPLTRLITRCLEKDPARRFADAREVHAELAAQRDQRRKAAAAGEGGGRRLMLVAGIALVVALVVLAFWWRQESRRRWVREAVPEIEKLFNDQQDPVGAFVLARKARELAPEDPQVRQAWANLTYATDIQSEPPGADVAIRSYDKLEGEWLSLGRTPLKQIELPYPLIRFRVQKDGFVPLELAPDGGGSDLFFRLRPPDPATAGMVAVAGGKHRYAGMAVDLPDFWIDRHEATNADYLRFVEAGGYRRPEFWKFPVVEAGRTLTFEETMTRLVDPTGQPGPATWTLGSFPEGQDSHPVSGISWYEAAAFAEFSGKSVPTVFHWSRAGFGYGLFSDILTKSNFGGQEKKPVGSLGGLGSSGTFDMAGNVKEWCLNANGEHRYALGGGYRDAAYQFVDPDALPPLERRADVGVRLIRQEAPIDPGHQAAFTPTQREPRPPVDDATFAVYARLSDYDPLPLDTRIEDVDDGHAAWRKEKVSFTAASGSERLTAYLFLPKNAKPPYQAVVFFPGNDATLVQSSRNLWLRMVEFYMRSGRAMIYPVYQGTYERRITTPLGANGLRDLRVQRTKEVRRAVDFLESRPDIDAGRIAFYGLSLGANHAPLVLATEPRFRTAILYGAGLRYLDQAPEIQVESYLPRVRLPLLFVGGRYDFSFPYELAQRPFFDQLGTPPAQKKHYVFEGGHLPIQFNDVVREILAWTDAQLGPVDKKLQGD